MIDFTSSLYLNFLHAWRDLPPWKQLSLGKPAALDSTTLGEDVEHDLAQLTGCQSALLGTSTLHLFWDLFTHLAQSNVNIFLDDSAYPILGWGASIAGSCGATVRRFRRHDIHALRRLLASADGRPPVIATDGYCPGCGRIADLRSYAEEANNRGGFLVVDDTQALGIFGAPSEKNLYGTGGGGSLLNRGLSGHESILLVSSLAKAFGAPLAMIAGSTDRIEKFKAQSATRVHCSPPSVAAITAASEALRINRKWGDALRRRLLSLIDHFQKSLHRIGLCSTGGIFPIQSLCLPESLQAGDLEKGLGRRGIKAVLHRIEGTARPRLSFIVTTRHSENEIDAAVQALSEVVMHRHREIFKGVS